MCEKVSGEIVPVFSLEVAEGALLRVVGVMATAVQVVQRLIPENNAAFADKRGVTFHKFGQNLLI